MSQPEEITRLRSQIQEINNQIIALIAKRTEVANKIGKLKEDNGLDIHQPTQEKKVLSACRKKARKRDIDPERVAEAFKEIIALARQRQQPGGKFS